jgi:hypothetical protein
MTPPVAEQQPDDARTRRMAVQARRIRMACMLRAEIARWQLHCAPLLATLVSPRNTDAHLNGVVAHVLFCPPLQERPMFIEQRLYTFAPGKSAEFNRLYEEQGRAPQERHLGLPVGYYYSEIGPLNQVMTLWAYETLNERVERRERLFNDPEWIAFLQKARALVVTQETRILKPASFFNERLKSFVELGKEKRS